MRYYAAIMCVMFGAGYGAGGEPNSQMKEPCYDSTFMLLLLLLRSVK